MADRKEQSGSAYPSAIALAVMLVMTPIAFLKR
jgi:hypothetical protein